MNIIRVCPVYDPYFSYGGSVIADWELDQALVAEGHTVSVITCRMRGDDRQYKKGSDNYEVRYFGAIGDIAYGFSVAALFRLFVTLRKKGDKTDLVWFGGVWNLLTVLGPIVCRLFSVNYVITPHGMLIARLIALRSSRLKTMAVRLFLKSNLEKAYKVHFTVEKEFFETAEATQAKMTPIVFPLCFNLRKFDEGIRFPKSGTGGGRVVLSFIGRITPKKRIDLIFSALKSLPRVSKAKLLFRVVGSDAEALWNSDAYTEKEIGLPVQFLGPLYGAELTSAFDTTDIFILCSESENFAISVVEAAYCYSALLISREVGVSEYFTGNSAIYARLSAADISRKIQDLLDNPAKIYECKLAARKVSEQFDSAYLNKTHFEDLLS